MKKLNQVIALEKSIKSRSCSKISELHKLSQKSDLFNGFIKTYSKKDEDGEEFPQEKKKVQLNAIEQLNNFSDSLTELFDITAIKDFTNCNAFADIVVDGKVLVEKAPTTFILFLEKQVNDIRTFVNNIPVLDEAEDWSKDDNSGLYKTNSVKTHKTKKLQKPIILAEATDKHQAITQLITEDVVVGYWDTIKHSGSLPLPVKTAIIERINKFADAVKTAREKANITDTEEKKIGNQIFKYLFNI
jgi:hypothetical protein